MNIPDKLPFAKKKTGRERPERVTLIVSIVLLIVLFGGLAALHLTRDTPKPPEIEVVPDFDKASQRGDAWYLPVEVTNVGDEPTDTVRVALERPDEDGGEPEVAELDFTFVAGGESVAGVAVFDERPTASTVTIDAISYSEP
ncbi:MAG: hypothetical protein JWM90_2638 [Thermoleophilia bacterium]|nr:hypothetical protein [Thermoleophilia bacterium]